MAAGDASRPRAGASGGFDASEKVLDQALQRIGNAADIAGGGRDRRGELVGGLGRLGGLGDLAGEPARILGEVGDDGRDVTGDGMLLLDRGGDLGGTVIDGANGADKGLDPVHRGLDRADNATHLPLDGDRGAGRLAGQVLDL